jgi:non-ribosomal peptide synthetase component F
MKTRKTSAQRLAEKAAIAEAAFQKSLEEGSAARERYQRLNEISERRAAEILAEGRADERGVLTQVFTPELIVAGAALNEALDTSLAALAAKIRAAHAANRAAKHAAQVPAVPTR